MMINLENTDYTYQRNLFKNLYWKKMISWTEYIDCVKELELRFKDKDKGQIA